MTDREVMQMALEPVRKHEAWCASLTQLLLSHPSKPAPCNCNTKLAEPEPEPEPEPLASVNRYCRAGMCVETDDQHEAFCKRHSSHIKQGAPPARRSEPEPESEPVAVRWRYPGCRWSYDDYTPGAYYGPMVEIQKLYA